jgi:hypothetical protein
MLQYKTHFFRIMRLSMVWGKNTLRFERVTVVPFLRYRLRAQA